MLNRKACTDGRRNSMPQRRDTRVGKVTNLAVKTQEGLDVEEVVVEDRRAGPAEVVAARIDFGDFLRSLSSRYRRIAAVLATGESTTATARKFHVSPGRVSPGDYPRFREFLERIDQAERAPLVLEERAK